MLVKVLGEGLILFGASLHGVQKKAELDTKECKDGVLYFD